MSAAPELDVFSCPLDGIRLVEASAGTGKTWNICGLYLRLLLERELPVESLLVVTFTKAATAELSGRIRERIVETLQILEGGTPGPDPFVPQLLAHLAAAGHAQEQLATRLRLALQTFDEAAIFTIHGFCQRALADTPFAAGLPYELELVEDETELDPEENLIYYGLDSVQVMKLAGELKERGVIVGFDDLARVPTLNGWWSLIEQRRLAA